MDTRVCRAAVKASVNSRMYNMFRVSCSLRLAIALFGVLGAEAALQSAVQPCSRTNRPAISMLSKDLEPLRKSSRFDYEDPAFGLLFLPSAAMGDSAYCACLLTLSFAALLAKRKAITSVPSTVLYPAVYIGSLLLATLLSQLVPELAVAPAADSLELSVDARTFEICATLFSLGYVWLQANSEGDVRR